jgi:hypothetical protein
MIEFTDFYRSYESDCGRRNPSGKFASYTARARLLPMACIDYQNKII